MEKSNCMDTQAYITLLSSKNYLNGVIVLHRSLGNTGAKYPLYCVLSTSVDNETEQKLVNEGIKCIRLNCVAVENDANADGGALSYWNYTFDKLLVWGLTQFEKIVFLDSDMMVVRNIDSLFECEPFSAVDADSWYPGNENWRGYLNSGIMVIKPDVEVQNTLLQLVDKVVEEGRKRNMAVGDQDVIKCYLAEWNKHTSLHLDQGYNLFADHLTYYMRHLGYDLDGEKGKPVFVVHFVGRWKPWMNNSLKDWLCLLKKCMKNPGYYRIYKMFLRYLKND